MPTFLVTVTGPARRCDSSRPVDDLFDWLFQAATVDELIVTGFIVTDGRPTNEYCVTHVVEAESDAAVRARFAPNQPNESRLRVDAVDPTTTALETT